MNNIPVLVISEEPNTIELFKKIVEELDKFSYLASSSDFTKAICALKELDKGLVIVDISQYQEQGLNFVSKITAEIPKLKVLVVSDKPDVDLLIRAMRVGAHDFLALPLIKTDFIDVLQKIAGEIENKKSEKSKCRIISVYSNKGGVGKTSIASNLAYELAKITKENVALVDLNFQLGDVATFLDLKPSFNISYMLNNLDKIKDEFLLSTMEKYKDTSLYVLADSPYFKSTDKIPTQDITKLFNILRKTFSYVIVDTVGGFDDTAFTALRNSDLILFAAIVNLPSLRNCQRCLELFKNLDFDDNKIQILINRYMENDEIKAEQVEELLGRKIYWKIPNNYFTMMAAINKGVLAAEVNPDSNVALGYKNLALLISDSLYRKGLSWKKVN